LKSLAQTFHSTGEEHKFKSLKSYHEGIFHSQLSQTTQFEFDSEPARANKTKAHLGIVFIVVTIYK
jgi:hypothetical protein